MIDLDELLLKCRDDSARQYINEAVSSYKAGAYRSSIVSTWTAIIFDFISKINELNIAGDKQSSAVIDELKKIQNGEENAIKRSLIFESNVIKECKDNFNLISEIEAIDLERIREDRNRCAHATMQSTTRPYTPTAELARTHIRSAVEILLSKEPVQGKAALDEIINTISSDYFPKDSNNAIIALKSTPLKRARPSLARNLVTALLKSYINNNDSTFAQQNRMLAALSATFELYRGHAEEILQQKFSEFVTRGTSDNFYRISNIIHKIPVAYNYIDEPSKIYIRNYIESDDNDKKYAVFIISMMAFDEFKDICLSKIAALNRNIQKEIFLKRPSIDLIELGLTHLRGSSSFREAESNLEGFVLPLLQYYQAADIQSLLEITIMNDQIWDATGTPSILSKIYQETPNLRPDTDPFWDTFRQEITNQDQHQYYSDLFSHFGSTP